VWVIDAGYVAKVRPCLILTGPPTEDELDLVTVVFHTTSLRGNRWELKIPKPFLREGAFHLQEIHSAPIPRLERKLGTLTADEFDRVRNKLAERLGIITG
jgi:mRNA interferase MazF